MICEDLSQNLSYVGNSTSPLVVSFPLKKSIKSTYVTHAL